MKNTLTLSCFLLITLIAKSQVSDQVILNPGYTNEVYYQLGSQTKNAVPFSSWDIGFGTDLMTASIIADPNNVTVYIDPNADSLNYATLDTTGYTSWPQLYNSDTSWFKGAFNMTANLSNPFDFGWGVYDFTSHTVFGDSIFLIKKGASLYKFWIERKSPDGFYFIHYANAAGGADATLEIHAEQVTTKNFVFFNLDGSSMLDLEPVKTDWDILFTRYMTFIQGVGYYPVVGVQSNIGVTAAKASGVDVNTAYYANYLNDFSTNLSEIGYDWKFFDLNTFSYSIVDSLVYFVKALDGNYYKLQFTGFNDTTGTISFESTQSLTGINEIKNGTLESAAVFPNPVNDHLSLVFNSKEALDGVDVNLYSVDGKNVFHSKVNAQSGMNQKEISLPKLSNGLYALRMSEGSDEINLKVIVSR